MNGYVEAGYAVTLAVLAAYGLSLRRREQRALRRPPLPEVAEEEGEGR